MRISDLRERLTLSFGPEWAPSFSADIALSSLGSLTVNEAGSRPRSSGYLAGSV
jgi:hypothetical protein